MLFLDKNAMKGKLLILLLFCYVYNGIGQTTETITIDWGFNSTPSASGNANTNRTIEVGDTVIWNWYSNGTHNVNSLPSATETFESAYFGNGGSFSYTFMSEGDNPFQCDPHAGNPSRARPVRLVRRRGGRSRGLFGWHGGTPQ